MGILLDGEGYPILDGFGEYILDGNESVKFTAVQNGELFDGATWGNTSPGVSHVDYPDESGGDTIEIPKDILVAFNTTGPVKGVGVETAAPGYISGGDVYGGLQLGGVEGAWGELILLGELRFHSSGEDGFYVLGPDGSLAPIEYIKIISKQKYVINWIWPFNTSSDQLLFGRNSFPYLG